jgi:hypothetical protein
LRRNIIAFNVGDIKEFVSEYKMSNGIAVDKELTVDQYGVFSEQLKDMLGKLLK